MSFTWVREQYFIRITYFIIIMCLSNVAVCVSVLRGDIARLRRCTALTTVSWTPLAIIEVCCVHSQVIHKTLAEALGEEKLSVPPLTLYISRQLVSLSWLSYGGLGWNFPIMWYTGRPGNSFPVIG